MKNTFETLLHRVREREREYRSIDEIKMKSEEEEEEEQRDRDNIGSKKQNFSHFLDNFPKKHCFQFTIKHRTQKM